MTPWRSRAGHLAPLVLALFVSGVAIPRPGLYFHVHAGGDHVHVHDEDATHVGHEHHHEAAHQHHHQDQLGRGAGVETELEAPEPADLGHWHTQHPFHRVVPIVPALLIRASLITAVPAERVADVPASGVRFAYARGPPLPSVVS